MRPSFASTAAIVFASMLVASATQAMTFTVDTTGDAVDALPGDGVCASAAAQCTLRAAVQEAGATAGADRVEIPAGNYVLTIPGRNENASATGDLDLRDEITLHGAGAAGTIIDAGALDRVVDVDNSGTTALTVRIESLTLRNGLLDTAPTDGSGQGAGLRVRGDTTVELLDVDIRDNVLAFFSGGGGIDNRGCVRGTRVRIVGNGDPNINGNRRATAGGIAQSNNAADSACLVLDDSEISDNDGDQAGALYADQEAPVTFRRTLIHGNSARFAGAALLNQRNDVLLEDVTMSGNAGGSGATLNDGGSTLTLRNCTVTGNVGIPGAGPPTVGGLGDVHGGFGRTFLSNTIVAGNGPGFLADDCDRGVSVDGGNIIGSSADCNFQSLPSDQLDVNPQLGALADNGGFSRTHLPGPAAIDHGVAVACTTTDQRGVSRPQDGDGDGTATCDAGALEVAAPRLFADGFE